MINNVLENHTLDLEFIDYSFLKMYRLPDLTKYINLKVLNLIKYLYF